MLQLLVSAVLLIALLETVEETDLGRGAAALIAIVTVAGGWSVTILLTTLIGWPGFLLVVTLLAALIFVLKNPGIKQAMKVGAIVIVANGVMVLAFSSLFHS